MELRGFLIMLVAAILNLLVDGSHFRGGSLAWEPVGENRTRIEVHYRVGWRLNFEPHYDCTEEAIKNETLIAGEGELMVVRRGGNEDTLFKEIYKEIVRKPLDYICTDRFVEGFDGEFHWASGVNSFQMDVTESMGTHFDIGYFSCCWIGVLNYQQPKRWSMLTRVNLTPRPDNGRLNTSPMTSSLPLLRIQQGCEFILDIPYYDKDDDVIRCRWTRAIKNECTPPNCGRPHRVFTIKDRTCMIHIDTGLAEVGWYAVAVMMEDFLDPIASKPLSSVSLHFLVRVDEGNRECNDVITTVPPSTCLAVTPGERFHYQATARTMTPEIPIVNFASTSPRKMRKSNVTSHGNGTYSVEYDWLPPLELNGTVETFCYSAFDHEKFSGNEVCVELVVGGIHPCLQSAHSIPGSEGTPVSLLNIIWELVYDQEILINHEAAEPLAIIRDAVSGVAVLNVTTTNVIRDVDQHTLILTFWAPLINMLAENSIYEIEIFPGIVRGTLHCMLPSMGASWVFDTCVTPIPDSRSSVPSGSAGRTLTVLDFYWNITFHQPITLVPNTSLLAQVLTGSGEVLYNITTEDVLLMPPVNETYGISFLTPDWLYLEENAEYGFRVPAGIAINNRNCNMSSEENIWKFNTSSNFAGGRRSPYELRDPLVSVLCFPTFFEIFVDRSQFSTDMDPAMVTLNEAFCYGVEHNDTHFRLGSTYGQCGTTSLMNEDNTRVSMTNVIRIPSRAFPTDTHLLNPPPHPNYEVHVNCSLASRRLTFVELDPNISTVVFHSDVAENFNFSLKMFPDDQYSGRYRVEDFPIVIEKDRRLYFEARAFAPKRYGSYLQSCVAAPTSLPHEDFKFTFIENGCPLSNSVMFHESSYSTRTRFSILAEELLEHGLNNYIFVHCDIRLCDRRKNECDATCLPETNDIPNEIGPILRRSVHAFAVSDEFMDTDGPIIIKHRDHARNEGDAASISWMQLAHTCVTALLGIACFVLIIIVIKLKRKPQPTLKTRGDVDVT